MVVVAVAVVLVSVVFNGAMTSVAIAVFRMAFLCDAEAIANGVVAGSNSGTVNAANRCGTCSGGCWTASEHVIRWLCVLMAWYTSWTPELKQMVD